jgi:hypothetical protein
MGWLSEERPARLVRRHRVQAKGSALSNNGRFLAAIRNKPDSAGQRPAEPDELAAVEARFILVVQCHAGTTTVLSTRGAFTEVDRQLQLSVLRNWIVFIIKSEEQRLVVGDVLSLRGIDEAEFGFGQIVEDVLCTHFGLHVEVVVRAFCPLTLCWGAKGLRSDKLGRDEHARTQVRHTLGVAGPGRGFGLGRLGLSRAKPDNCLAAGLRSHGGVSLVSRGDLAAGRLRMGECERETWVSLSHQRRSGQASAKRKPPSEGTVARESAVETEIADRRVERRVTAVRVVAQLSSYLDIVGVDGVQDHLTSGCGQRVERACWWRVGTDEGGHRATGDEDVALSSCSAHAFVVADEADAVELVGVACLTHAVHAVEELAAVEVRFRVGGHGRAPEVQCGTGGSVRAAGGRHGV